MTFSTRCCMMADIRLQRPVHFASAADRRYRWQARPTWILTTRRGSCPVGRVAPGLSQWHDPLAQVVELGEGKLAAQGVPDQFTPAPAGTAGGPGSPTR